MPVHNEGYLRFIMFSGPSLSGKTGQELFINSIELKQQELLLINIALEHFIGQWAIFNKININ